MFSHTLYCDDVESVSRSSSVRASISSCLPLTEESVTLNCPWGGVIFDPRVRMGSSGWDRSCSAVNGDCVGETPNSLVQRLQCYWQPTCRMSWQRGMPILRVTHERCLARLPDYFDLVGASCVPKGQIAYSELLMIINAKILFKKVLKICLIAL